MSLHKGSYTNHVATNGGGGVPQITTTLHNSYLVKMATLGGGVQNSEKNGYVVFVWPLTEIVYITCSLVCSLYFNCVIKMGCTIAQ